jgi:hypothetical protein
LDPSSAKEAAKAVQEVAKAASKGIDAATAMGGFIANYVRGPIEQGLGIFEDKLRYARWERQQRLMQRAEAFLVERGLSAPPNGVATKFVVPLLQAASLEEDDQLQDLWAHLLVNASIAPDVAMKRAFISMLENMSELDAHVLLRLRDVGAGLHDAIITRELPDRAQVWAQGMEQPLELPPEDVLFSLGNLGRLGTVTGLSTAGGGTSWAAVHLTILGRRLVDAVSPMAPQQP